MNTRKFPDTLTLIFSIMILFTILTWIIPAGEFEHEKIHGKTSIIPGTYHKVEQSPQHIHIFLGPIKGFISAADIIGFVFIVGGVFYIINATGAINALLFQIIEKSKKNKTLKSMVIPITMLFFSLGGATFGMAEETLVFIMITIPLALALGYDSIVGLSIPFIGASVGFAGAFMNPFTVGIAQGIAEVELFSGMAYRAFVWLIYSGIGIGFVMWYARRIEKDFSKSLVGHIDYGKDLTNLSPEEYALTGKRKTILYLLLFALILLVFGAQGEDHIGNLFGFSTGISGWYINEITALFVVLGLASGLVYRMNPETIVKNFGRGAGEMVMPAILIGFAKSILIIASDGKIIDTILYWVSSGAEGLHPAVSVQIMLYVQGFINTFVPSGSGQAALTMPLMAPLADVLGFTRQTAVLAYQFGDGITNMIIPTSAVLMGVLQIGKIPFNKWFRFILPLVIILYIVSMLLLIPPVMFFDWS